MPGEVVNIRIDSIQLEGDFDIPANEEKKIVIFAHGSGSSRLSPRNMQVADVLRKAGFGTLLFDLLTEEEDQNFENRFDIDLLTERLEKATHWVIDQFGFQDVRIGYFGASTGAAAALKAGGKLGSKTVSAIVSRGGRPDIVMPDLPKVDASTLLIVGERDEEVLGLNKLALKQIRSPIKQLVIIPTATHLFEEPGTLAKVAQHAADWFGKYL